MTSDFRKKVAAYIERYALIEPGARVIVGVSGGADSMALLDVLVSLGYRCVASHCNFHLRGEESDRDEYVARKLADRLGVDFVKTDFDVDARRAMTGESVEMACRTLRYEWWRQLRDELGIVRLAVAHHRDDNIETFFLNLMRGSGIAGLKGMLPVSEGIIRPLLGCTRAEIVSYCRHCQLEYIVDSTNLQNDYKRNRLRNIILPEIECNFPGASDAIGRSVDYLRENFEFYCSVINERRLVYQSPDGKVDLFALITGEKFPRIVLFEILSVRGFNMTQTDNIIASAEESGKIFYSESGETLLLDRGILKPIEDSEIEDRVIDIVSDQMFEMTMEDARDFTPDKDPWTIYLDEKVLDGNPVFAVRTWRKGDRIAPFGIKGTKKVSDIFNDAKISLNDKRKIKLLTRNGEILWIIGLRASRYFAVTSSTRQYIRLKSTKKSL